MKWLARVRVCREASEASGAESGGSSHVLYVVQRGLHLLLQEFALFALGHQVVCKGDAATVSHTHNSLPFAPNVQTIGNHFLLYYKIIRITTLPIWTFESNSTGKNNINNKTMLKITEKKITSKDRAVY